MQSSEIPLKGSVGEKLNTGHSYQGCTFPAASGDIYYTDAYGKLYEDIENGEYVKYVFESPLGTVIHPFIKRPVPWIIDGKQYYDIVTPYGYGGPLITHVAEATNRNELMAAFNRVLCNYCKENDIICEFIRFHTLFDNALYCNDMYMVNYNRNTIAIDLADSEFFATQFDSKCRNMVRKAEKLGVKVEVDEQLETIDVFKDIYHTTMTKDRADKYYFFTHQYFQRMRDTLSNQCLLVNAILDGTTIASALFLYEEGRYSHYHLSATLPEYYKVAANNLILKAACDALRSHACTWLHLGGGLSSDPSDSLLTFKRSFGRLDKNRKDFYIGKKVWNPAAYERVVDEYIDAGGGRNSFFPEYRG